MIDFKWYESGSLFGIEYRFEMAGDALPIHQHAEPESHNCIVRRGMVGVEYGPTERYMHVPGDVVEIRWDRPHTIRSMVHDSVILNLFLHGRPREYGVIPEAERQGRIDGIAPWTP